MSNQVEARLDPLPELVSVHWRQRVTLQTLTRSGRLWTLTTVAHTVPLIAAAVALAAVKPILVPISLVLLAHAWAIPELYAARGANVAKEGRGHRGSDFDASHTRALGLLADLVDHAPRELHQRTGLVMEHGRLGVWLLGEAGAVLVRRGGHRVHCYCVRASDPDLPPADRTSHLLLALRTDESGFATVANQAFSGAPWRLRRRLAANRRAALDAAVREARAA